MACCGLWLGHLLEVRVLNDELVQSSRAVVDRRSLVGEAPL